ncbi:MAG: COX15/CtaA family protein [Lentisphaerae bacterium]|nr:COX15/CtaA family protein [Lentisphaerota bacterium]
MNSENTQGTYHIGRASLAILTCFTTLILIFAGGVVTSKNVGLSVPDWPTSYGYHMWGMPFSMWKGGVLYEHLHRVIASAAGCLILILTTWLIFSEPRRWVRSTAIACFGTVVIQGILGGMTVLLALPTCVSVLHAILAQVFLCLTVALAFSLSREGCRTADPALRTPPTRSFKRAAIVTICLVFTQLALAAYMRHDMKQQGGVAIPDFPRVAGRLVPRLNAEGVAWVNAWRSEAVWEHGAKFELSQPVQAYQMHTHFTHRCMALLILVSLFWMTKAAIQHYPRKHGVILTLRGVGALLVVEIVLGMFSVWSNKGELITSLHVVTGAALLASLVLVAMRAFSPSALPSAGAAAP